MENYFECLGDNLKYIYLGYFAILAVAAGLLSDGLCEVSQVLVVLITSTHFLLAVVLVASFGLTPTLRSRYSPFFWWGILAILADATTAVGLAAAFVVLTKSCAKHAWLPIILAAVGNAGCTTIQFFKLRTIDG